MQILLIVATGQIGYALALILAKSENQLRVLVRNKKKLPFPNDVEVLASQQFTAEAYKRAFENVDLAIYGVGLPEQFTLSNDSFERVNYGLLTKFFRSLEQSMVKRLISISTYEVFSGVNNTIRESHSIAAASQMTPYFQAMIKAYRIVTEYAAEHDLALTTIHPAAVYGGMNTGNGIIRSFGHSSAFMVSDQITSLRQIAEVLSRLTHQRSIVPLTAPLCLVRPSATLMETIANICKVRPLIARVQIKFITYGLEPLSDKAQHELQLGAVIVVK